MELRYFEIHLAEHCNLNCRGCFHFSPLAEKSLLSMDIFVRDFERIAELTNGRVGTICLMGGEPLLHPEIENICEIARKYFPKTNITILTNGVKLLSMKDSFFENCKRNNIKIMGSAYPGINWEKIVAKLSVYDIMLEYHAFQKGNRLILAHHCFDLQGKQSIKNNLLACHRPGVCVTLKNGKLFSCIMPAHIEHFNKYFNENLKVTDEDYLDIYRANNLEEILNYLVKPIPFCKYCDLSQYENGEYNNCEEYGTSKRKIEEWT